MLTATNDVILPATVTGSWPRPRWFTAGLWGRTLDRAMLDIGYREQLQDALSAVLDDQERAGLDILTNGDYFHDEDLAGHSWLSYPVERWEGFDAGGDAHARRHPTRLDRSCTRSIRAGAGHGSWGRSRRARSGPLATRRSTVSRSSGPGSR